MGKRLGIILFLFIVLTISSTFYFYDGIYRERKDDNVINITNDKPIDTNEIKKDPITEVFTPFGWNTSDDEVKKSFPHAKYTTTDWHDENQTPHITSYFEGIEIKRFGKAVLEIDRIKKTIFSISISTTDLRKPCLRDHRPSYCSNIYGEELINRFYGIKEFLIQENGEPSKVEQRPVESDEYFNAKEETIVWEKQGYNIYMSMGIENEDGDMWSVNVSIQKHR